MNVEAKKKEVYIRQIGLLYDQSKSSMVGHAVLAVLAVFTLRNQIEFLVLSVWAGIVVVLQVIRLMSLHAFNKVRDKESTEVFQQYERTFFYGILISGLLWGVYGLFLFPQDLTYQVFLTFVIGGMAGASTGTLAAEKKSFLAYVISSVLPITIRFFYEGEEMHIIIGSACLFYLVIIAGIGFRNHRTILSALQLKIENLNLEQEKVLVEKEARLKEEFLANMSHEIRTPMNGVIGMLDILATTKLDKKQQEYVNIIRQSSDNLLHILNDILDLSKLEEGKMNIKPEPTHFRELLNGIYGLFLASTREKGLKLSLNIAAEIPERLLIDGKRISQVLSNLVSNAIKFTENGEVTINVSGGKEDNDTYRIKIEVQDTGIGIDEDQLEKVFDKFTQVDKGYTKNFAGTGLGLTICKKMVELMGGDIGVQSVAGKGSNFWFTFLAKAAPEEVKQNEVKKRSEKFDLNILLVDDVPTNLIVARLMLEQIGCKVETASNGQLALDMFEEGKYDLVLMDIQMPVMDGLEATNQIKRKFKNTPPIIGLSAYTMEKESQKFIAEGMDDAIPKPIKFNQLYETLSKWTNPSEYAEV